MRTKVVSSSSSLLDLDQASDIELPEGLQTYGEACTIRAEIMAQFLRDILARHIRRWRRQRRARGPR